MASGPSESVLDELKQALQRAEGRFGIVFRLMESGAKTNREILERGGGANQGAVANTRVAVRLITDGILPASPSVAAQCAGRIRKLIRLNQELSPSALAYLNGLMESLDVIRFSDEAIADEEQLLEKNSKKLEIEIGERPGIYVYSLPSFLRVPQKFDPERFWLKIGRTNRTADARIAEQQRQTGLPEDPVLVRVYGIGEDSLEEAERRMHSMLEAAGHSRSSGRFTGREWFATNLEFLDEMAISFRFTIFRSSED
jgi:hypothetical protein